MLLGIYADFAWRRIPNALIVTAAAAQILLLFVATFTADALPGAADCPTALLGFVLGFVFLVFWILRVMGAGDVKFLAVLGLWVGWQPLLAILLIGGLASGVHGLILVMLMRRAAPAKVTYRGIPYAGYLALAALSVALTQWNSPLSSLFSSLFSTPS